MISKSSLRDIARQTRYRTVLTSCREKPLTVREIANRIGLSYSGTCNYINELIEQGKLQPASLLIDGVQAYVARDLDEIPRVYNSYTNELTPITELALPPNVKTKAETSIGNLGLYVCELIEAIKQKDIERIKEIQAIMYETWARLNAFNGVIKQLVDNVEFVDPDVLDTMRNNFTPEDFRTNEIRRQEWHEHIMERRLSTPDNLIGFDIPIPVKEDI